MVTGNPYNSNVKTDNAQRIQAVLMMEGLLPETGVDGLAQGKTWKALNDWAKKNGMENADRAAVEKALLDKLRDPAQRDKWLKDMAGRTQSTGVIIAEQVVLAAMNMDTNKMRDPATRLFTGKPSNDLTNALNNVEGGRPTAAAYSPTVPTQAATWAASGGSGGQLVKTFDVAVTATPAASPTMAATPAAAPAVKPVAAPA